MERYITLLGAEEVSRAASTMSSAASEMQRAASSMHSTMEVHHRFMDDWLQRFQTMMEKQS